MLDDLVGKWFWCIKPNMVREFLRKYAPMVPYQGELTRGEEGLASWYLVPDEYAHTKTIGQHTRITVEGDLFLDRTPACEAYITEQTDHIKKLEKELEQEEETLLDFVSKEANK